MLLSLDDTDSLRGGCTTHVALRVRQTLEATGLARPAGPVRLVRLNPNVPWKTRGNAALCIPLETDASTEAVVDAAWRVIEEEAAPDASPCVAAWTTPPPEAAYWAAVREVIQVDQAKAWAAEAAWRGSKQALVGCVAAAAWPGPASSHELIAYRKPTRLGTPRDVDARRLAWLDAAGATFHTWDPVEEVAACIPSTPCQVLVGLRGRCADTLQNVALPALQEAAGEPISDWHVFAANQASGDHVVDVATAADATEMQTVRLTATVETAATTGPGGHVRLPLRDAANHLFPAMAFEPTKRFRDVVRALRPGDNVRVTGGWGDGLRLERLDVRTLAEDRQKVANPVGASGRRMKSRGRGAGYRDTATGVVVSEDAAEYQTVPRALEVGNYEVPVMARRHLHRPAAWDFTSPRSGPPCA